MFSPFHPPCLLEECLSRMKAHSSCLSGMEHVWFAGGHVLVHSQQRVPASLIHQED